MAEYRRARHRNVARVLDALDAGVLTRANCYFGGGTRIGQAAEGIVIGQRIGLHAVAVRTRHQRGRRQQTVGMRRMAVQIDIQHVKILNKNK